MSAVRRSPAGQLGRYAALGAVGTVVHYLVLGALVELAGANPLLATTAGFAAGAVTNYLLNYYLLFASRLPHAGTFARFLAVAAAGAALNGVVFSGLLALGPHYLLAQLGATCAVVLLTFFANKRWTFRA